MSQAKAGCGLNPACRGGMKSLPRSSGRGGGEQEVDPRPDCRRPQGLSEGVRALGCGNREAVWRSQAEAGAVRAVLCSQIAASESGG